LAALAIDHLLHIGPAFAGRQSFQAMLPGTSYAGGHALVLGATDRRLRCVVAQAPTISGYEQGLRRVSPDATPALEHAFNEDERARLRGEPPRRQPVVSGDPSVPAAYRSREAIDFYLQPIPDGLWKNEVTLRSTLAARSTSPAPGLAAFRRRRC
jgi:hypothetical protein